MTVLKDISYGNYERHRADIYIPENPVSQSGLILFIHGGGWTSGDKDAHTPDAEYFASLGYISATMNYRYVSQNVHVDQVLDDVSSALEAIKKKCYEHGFDISKLILSGGSAGAHIALLYAYTRKDASPLLPVAICAYCPPTDCAKEDFLMGINGEFEGWKYEILSMVCGAEISKITLKNEAVQKALQKISPINYIDKNCVPTAVFYAKADELIPVSHIEDFEHKLTEANIKHDLVQYPNSGHTLDKDPASAETARSVIKRYAEMYL